MLSMLAVPVYYTHRGLTSSIFLFWRTPSILGRLYSQRAATCSASSATIVVCIFWPICTSDQGLRRRKASRGGGWVDMAQPPILDQACGEWDIYSTSPSFEGFNDGLYADCAVVN
jgi:hypothetical protein